MNSWHLTIILLQAITLVISCLTKWSWNPTSIGILPTTNDVSKCRRTACPRRFSISLLCALWLRCSVAVKPSLCFKEQWACLRKSFCQSICPTLKAAALKLGSEGYLKTIEVYTSAWLHHSHRASLLVHSYRNVKIRSLLFGWCMISIWICEHKYVVHCSTATLCPPCMLSARSTSLVSSATCPRPLLHSSILDGVSSYH